MALATLSIDLDAKLAKLEQGLNRAVQVSEQQAGRMQRAFEFAQGAAMTLAGAAAAAVGALQIRQGIDTLDYLDDLSEKYGIAASALSEYRFASEVAGTPTEALASGLRKLSTAAADGNRGLKLLGIETRTTNGDLKGTDALLLEVADKFAGYADGGAKAALAVEIFGKAGADLIPLLNKGAQGIAGLRDEAKRLGVSFSDDAARQAGEFNDNLKRISLAAQGLAIDISSKMLPALVELSNEYLKAAERGDRLATLWERIKGNSGFDQMARDQKAAITLSADLQRAAGYVEEFQRALQTNPQNTSLQKQLAWARQNYDEVARAAAAANEKLKATANILAPVQTETTAAAAPQKTQAPSIDKEAEAAAKRRDEAFQKFMQKLQQQRAVVQAELDIGQQLSEADKERGRLLAELADKTINYTAAQKRLGTAEVDRLVNAQRSLQAQKESIATLKAVQAIEAAQLRAREAENEALARQSQALADQLQEDGLTADQLDALRISRLQHTLAIERENLAMLQNAGASAQQIAEGERTIRLLDQQISRRGQLADQQQRERRDGTGGLIKGLDEYLEAVKDVGVSTRQIAGQAARGLEDDLTASLKTGRLDVSRTIDFIISEFLRLQVVQPLMKSLFSGLGGSTGIVGGLAKLLGFADGGAFGATRPIPFAAGGVFNSATLFKFTNGGAMATGVLGEAGPEAVMPLSRGPGGKLGVRNYGGGSRPVVNIHQTINVSGGASRNDVAAAMQVAKRQAVAEVYDAMRRGRSVQGA